MRADPTHEGTALKTSAIEAHDMLSVFSVGEVEKRIGESHAGHAPLAAPSESPKSAAPTSAASATAAKGPADSAPPDEPQAEPAIAPSGAAQPDKAAVEKG